MQKQFGNIKKKNQVIVITLREWKALIFFVLFCFKRKLQHVVVSRSPQNHDNRDEMKGLHRFFTSSVEYVNENKKEIRIITNAIPQFKKL